MSKELNRKQRRDIQRNAARRRGEKQPADLSRREFLGRLGLGLGAMGVAGVGGWRILENRRDEDKPFLDRVAGFHWRDINSPEDLTTIIKSGVREYLRVTNSPNLTESALLEPGKINFYNTTLEFQEAIKKLKPYEVRTTAYADYNYSKLFFNIERLKTEARRRPESDGAHLTRLLFHELGHIDISSRSNGEQMNNPEYYFKNPWLGINEPYAFYRGFQVYTPSKFYGFDQFEEAVLDTLAHRLLVERVGLSEWEVYPYTWGSMYYQSGGDIFLQFSRKYIPLETLYRLHTTSDFDGIVDLAGSKLLKPENLTPRQRGRELLIGIQERNPQRIAATGVY